VQQGDPLILYDNIELGDLIGQYLSERAQLQNHLAQLDVARKFHERGVELLRAQAIAEKEVELREAQLKNAQAMVQSRRSENAKTEEKLHRFGLSEEEIIGLENHQGEGGHRTASHNILRAPFSGAIIGYDVAAGELVEPSRELLTLADVSTVWVLADVYEKDLGRIREGQEVDILSASYPQRTFRGQLTYISDILERETRTARVRCVVSNPSNLLKLEMFVTVRIPTADEKWAVAVPEGAIQNIDDRDVVFAAEGKGRFRKVPVTTGLQTDGWIEVRELEEKTDVVGEGSFYLKTALKRSEIEPEHGH
jgi:cobalt-zinc-cadmium efflux system membrane fusion protein